MRQLLIILIILICGCGPRQLISDDEYTMLVGEGCYKGSAAYSAIIKRKIVVEKFPLETSAYLTGQALTQCWSHQYYLFRLTKEQQLDELKEYSCVVFLRGMLVMNDIGEDKLLTLLDWSCSKEVTFEKPYPTR